MLASLGFLSANAAIKKKLLLLNVTIEIKQSNYIMTYFGEKMM